MQNMFTTTAFTVPLRPRSSTLVQTTRIVYHGFSSAADIVKGPSLLRTSVSTRPRPSLLHLPGLRALPVWTQFVADTSSNQPTTGGNVDCGGQTRVAYSDPTVSSVVEHLEANWEAIWKEYQAVAPGLKSDYQTDTEHSKLHQGNWDWHSFMSKGIVNDENSVGGATAAFATNFPVTTSILSHLRQSQQLFEGTPFGYAFFSTLHGSSKIAPHTAPMNLRLRIHLALQVPMGEDNAPSTRPPCGMRIGGLVRTWHTGKCLVIDDAYEHEVWNETEHARVVLLVDIWHPDIALSERLEIMAMFETAKQKGWLSTA
jgi:Aspartyl/Asparaginyl beta-hydroxylase